MKRFLISLRIGWTMFITLLLMANLLFIGEVNDKVIDIKDNQKKFSLSQIVINQSFLKLIERQKDLEKTTTKVGEEINDLQEFNNAVVKNFNSLAKDVCSLHRQPSYQDLVDVSVIVLTDSNTAGSGVIIKITEDYTYVLTNRHVVLDDKGKKEKVTVWNGYGSKVKADIIKISVLVDLAVVRFPMGFSGKKAIVGINIPKYAEKVYSVGYNLRRKYLYGEGVFSGAGLDNSDCFQLPIMSGCSGAGIFNSNGELVGLIYSHSYYKMKKLGYIHDIPHANAVPSVYILNFIEEYMKE